MNEQASTDKKETVLITGITGYIGSWVAQTILAQHSDKYQVKATVRSVKKASSLRDEGLFGEELFDQIEFVEASFQNVQQLKNAVEGCQYIVHVANPVYNDKEKITENDLIVAVESSMKALIDAAVEHKVKRIVLTSSLASVIGDLYKKRIGEDHYSELDFSPECGDPYTIGKIRQEAYVRNFLAEQEKSSKEGDHKVEIVVLNLCYVIGPTLIKSVQSSIAPLYKLMDGSMPGVIAVMFPMVDVRTVAQAHMQALERPGISNYVLNKVGGERFIIGDEHLWFTDIAALLAQEFEQYGYKIPQNTLGYLLLKFVALFDSQAKVASTMYNQKYTVDNKKSKDLLGVVYDRDTKKSMVDLIHQFIDLGMLKDLRSKVLIS